MAAIRPICAHTIGMAIDIGLVGGSIEDATGDPDEPVLPIGLATDRIRAAAEVAKDRGFLLTGRAENFISGRPDLADTIKTLASLFRGRRGCAYTRPDCRI